MIVARAKRNSPKGQGQVIILGLTQENVIHLTEGKPMVINRKTHGDGIPDGWEIVIVFGKTNSDIADALRPAVNEQTTVRAFPSTKQNP
jgi:hypothetical protein